MGNDKQVWCDCVGQVAKESDEAVAFEVKGRSKWLWVPKSKLTTIQYEQGGDDEAIRVGSKVLAIEVPLWLARQHDLDFDWQSDED